ncbi:MAG: isochorismate synthase [Bacteroidota bacterium]|nr:isochorismate synthase [Bacteroidota bacterium]
MTKDYNNLVRLQNLLHSFVNNAIPFVCYRLPQSSSIIVSVFNQHKIKEINNSEDIRNEGFVFYPFDANKETPGLFIEPSFSFSNENIPTDFSFDFSKSEPQNLNFPNRVIQSEKIVRQNYFIGITEILKKIDNASIDKVVLSRTKYISDCSINRAPDILIELIKSYDNAFAYLLFIPGKMAWMGASPEILIESDGENFRTISLAGTVLCEKHEEKIWNKKELHEQKLVSSFIEDTLIKNNVRELKQKGPFTVRAGNLFHLRSDFTFKSYAQKFSKIAFDLHPTPAVCGLPQDLAKEIILKVEKHNRQYYSGFLGPVKNGKSNLYVNLRCMQFLNNGLVLYAGGGIVKGSEPEKEWAETENKTKTLLSIIEKISKFA